MQNIPELNSAVEEAKQRHLERLESLKAQAAEDGDEESDEPRPFYIMRSNCQFRVGWDLFMLSLLVYVAIAVPYREGFGVYPRQGWKIFELSVDGCFLADVVLNFFTTVILTAEDGSDKPIVRRKEIARYDIIFFDDTVK